MANLTYFYRPDVDQPLDHLAARCRHLATLKAGWLDGEGAAIDQRCADRAYRWLAPLVEDGTFIKAPCVYPRPDGSIQAEFGGADLTWLLGCSAGELVFELDGSVAVAIDLVWGATKETVLHPHDAWSAARDFRRFVDGIRFAE